jgi:hypothetical protein
VAQDIISMVPLRVLVVYLLSSLSRESQVLVDMMLRLDRIVNTTSSETQPPKNGIVESHMILQPA